MYWELGFLRVFLCTIISPYFIVKSLQLHGRSQIAESRKYCLVRMIVFLWHVFSLFVLFLIVGILVKYPTINSLACFSEKFNHILQFSRNVKTTQDAHENCLQI